jgi:hypothetical protein
MNSNVKIIEVSKKAYSVIRSIVDSSTKPSYEWNKPIVLENGKVKFVKYKVLPNGLEVKAWVITVEPMKIQKEGAELDAVRIAVYDGFGSKVAELRVRETFLPSEQDLDGFKPYVLKIAGHEIIAKSIHELEYYVMVPDCDVPFAEPIPLAALANKLMFYLYKALQVTQNADASKANEI